MKPLRTYRPFFTSEKSAIRPNTPLIKEETEDIELRIAESPPESRGDFKAIDIGSLTLSYDGDEISVLHTPDSHLYIRTYGKLIVLYRDRKDLEGIWFVSEGTQYIDMNDPQKSGS